MTGAAAVRLASAALVPIFVSGGGSPPPLEEPAAGSGALVSQAAPPSIEGGWEAVEYILATGPRHPVRGRIFFTRDEWVVLFFVMDGDEPRRGSGEGGRYTLAGDELVFEHLFHLSAGGALEGLPESPLEMTARAGEGPLEPTRVDLAEDTMTLRFPSGNAMRFRRGSRP